MSRTAGSPSSSAPPASPAPPAERTSASAPDPLPLLTRLVRLAGWVALALLVVAWAVLLRPEALGGRTTFVNVRGTSMLPTYRTGDLLVVQRGGPYGTGDAVAYRVPAGEPGAGHVVVHRIVRVRSDGSFVMQGDNNSFLDAWHPRTADVVGRVAFHLPGVGASVSRLTRPTGLAVVVGLLTLLVVGPLLLRRPVRHPVRHPARRPAHHTDGRSSSAGVARPTVAAGARPGDGRRRARSVRR